MHFIVMLDTHGSKVILLHILNLILDTSLVLFGCSDRHVVKISEVLVSSCRLRGSQMEFIELLVHSLDNFLI